MNMTVQQAREYLGVPYIATQEELQEAVDRKIDEATRQNQPPLATMAFEAMTVVLVDDDKMTQDRADQFLAEMSARVASFTARIDQSHASLAEVNERYVAGFAGVIELNERIEREKQELSSLEARREELLRKQQEIYDRSLTKYYAAARSAAKGRIARRKFIGHIKSMFSKK